MSFVGRLRTVRLLSVVREYSALSIVVAGAILVSGNNIRANNEIFRERQEGYFHNESRFSFHNTPANYQNIAFIPHVKAGLSLKEDSSELADLHPTISYTPNSNISYFSAQNIIAIANAMEKDPEEEGGVKIYTVETGDTVSQIAAKNNITVNTLLWANNLDDADSIMPGDQIFILPVSGVKYVIQSNDSLESIAKKYKADTEQIIAFNSLPANGKVESGMEIIIPGGQIETEQESQSTQSDTLIARRQYTSTETSGANVKSNNNGYNHFPYGYCTWYVAQKRLVPWHGNAGTWLYNAKSMGYATGKAPRVGSIVVTTESPYYGHVALVEKISNGTITVSEMNYKGWAKKSTRTLSSASRVIKGYIY